MSKYLVCCANSSVAIFAYDHQDRSFEKIQIPKFCLKDQFDVQAVSMGSLLFCWGVNRECGEYAEYFTDCCHRCSGTNYKRPRVGRCCSILGVLDINKIERGWTYLPVPEIHYVPRSAQLAVDGGNLMIFGGQEKNYRPTRGPRVPGKKIEGYYVLKLWEQSFAWKLRECTVPEKFVVVRGKMITLQQVFPSEFCRQHNEAVLVEYD